MMWRAVTALVAAMAAGPVAARCSVPLRAVVGAWSSIDARADRSEMFPNGDSYEINLLVEDGRRVYREYLHARPGDEGSWTYARCRLTLVGTGGTRQHFVVTGATRRRLTLRPVDGGGVERFSRVD